MARVRRDCGTWLALTALCGCFQASTPDGGTPRDSGTRVDTGTMPDGGLDGFCRVLADGTCSEMNEFSCTFHLAEPVDVARGCISGVSQPAACSVGMIACEPTSPTCFQIRQYDGSIATFVTTCVWPDLETHPDISPCNRDLEAAIAENGRCG